jgi:ParB family transcriptional regulator, chromosome partitioning protein
MARQALGKGLGALIPGHLRELDPDAKGGAQDLPIAEIRRNPYQPRTVFKADELKALADSIREQGVLQPVLVVRAKSGGYELVSGERRLRAAQQLGWQRIPAVVKPSATPQEFAEWAIIENVQRDDLNPLEEARAYKRLVDEFNQTQEEVAKKVGRERSTVANSLRLLKLPVEVQALLEKGELQMGHARALLAIDSADAQKALGSRAAREGWSVRAVEQAASERGGGGPKARKAGRRAANVELGALEEKLRRKLGTKVKLLPAAKGGRIEIHYYSAEELERLIDLLS